MKVGKPLGAGPSIPQGERRWGLHEPAWLSARYAALRSHQPALRSHQPALRSHQPALAPRSVRTEVSKCLAPKLN